MLIHYWYLYRSNVLRVKFWTSTLLRCHEGRGAAEIRCTHPLIISLKLCWNRPNLFLASSDSRRNSFNATSMPIKPPGSICSIILAQMRGTNATTDFSAKAISLSDEIIEDCD